MERKLPSGYFYKDGMPTFENIKSWIFYFHFGGDINDEKVNTEAFAKMQTKMGWESQKNGFVCFLWGLDPNALNSKNTGEYAKMMIKAKNIAWEIQKLFREDSDIRKYNTSQILGSIEAGKQLEMEYELRDLRFANEFNVRLIQSGDSRFFYMKPNVNLCFNYGKYQGMDVLDVINHDMGYMLKVVGENSEISNWVKQDIMEFMIVKMTRQKNYYKTNGKSEEPETRAKILYEERLKLVKEVRDMKVNQDS